MLIPLEKLQDNKLSTNVMTDEVRGKLKANIKRQKKYPALVVRKIQDPPTDFDKENTIGKLKGYRIIDGHNRKWALKELGYTQAECEIWDIDDKTEILLLATLNELRGTSDLMRRAILLRTLEGIGIERNNLLKLIPEDNRRLEFALSILKKTPDLQEITDEVQRRNLEIEAERQALRERFIKEGIDPKRAEAMADIYAFKKYVPVLPPTVEGKKIQVRFLLTFFFDNEEDFKLACNYFGAGEDGKKEPNTTKLLDLIK